MFVAFFTLGLLGLGYMQFLDSRLIQRAYMSAEPHEATQSPHLQGEQ